MKHQFVVLIAALAALSCADPAQVREAGPSAPREAAQTAPEPDIDAGNLLNLAYGASVVSRTGEFNLEESAAHAIDGMPYTLWRSPPGDPRQTLTFSLPAPARISRIGVSVTRADVPETVMFEASLDGASWHEAGSIRAFAGKGTQLFDVKPFTARYVRVRIVEESASYALFPSIHALGEETAPAPFLPSIDGCWNMDGLDARFVQAGARVSGVIASSPPTFLEGGTDGRVARMMWVRGPSWGYAVVTGPPDGSAITGLTIHEEIDAKNAGAAFFGRRRECGSASGPAPGIAAADLLDRAGRFSIYGIAFDASGRLAAEPSREALDAVVALLAARPSQRFRVIAHELREPGPAENHKRTVARIESLRAALQTRGVDVSRIELVGAGSNWHGPAISFAIQRLLASRVDLEPAP